jgi:hypothetical protein
MTSDTVRWFGLTHEQFVEEMATGVFGAYSINHPFEEAKGSATREPGDFIFMGLGVVVICLVTERLPHPTKDEAKFRKGVAHNLEQAHGVIRRWRASDRPIEAERHGNKRQLRWGDKKVVVLSIVDSPVAKAIDHREFATSNDIALASTVPTAALILMSHRQFSIVDLLSFLRDVRDSREEWNVTRVMEWIATRHTDAWFQTGAVRRWQVMDERFWREYLPVQVVRMTRRDVKGRYTSLLGDPAEEGMHLLLNDLPHWQILSLSLSVAEALNERRSQGDLLTLVPGPFHHLTVFCSDGDIKAADIGAAIDQFGHLERARKARKGPILLLPRKAGFIVGYLNWERTGCGHAEYLCRSMFL